MSRRKQANPRSLRVSIDSVNALLGDEAPKQEQTDETSENNLASLLFKNMTNQTDLNENRKLYQLAKKTIEYLENQTKEIKKEPIETRSRSSSSSSSKSSIDVTTVDDKIKSPQIETKKPQRKRFNNNSQNDSQNSNAIIINGKRYYPLKFTCENCGLRYSDQSTLDTHKQNYCTKRNQSKMSSTESSSSDESSPSSSRSSTPAKTLNKDASNVHLLKSVMYQCSMCTFQSDKKSAMNRHSRIHLPQKRKQMEEQNSTKTSTDDLDDESNTDKSYCKECDIQFSSVKTFLHHRNNYCKKFRTIETVVPVPAGQLDVKKPKVIPTTIPPAPPIRMGDLVYLPVYKINDKETPSVSTPLDLTVPKQNETEADGETEPSLPLDLSIKKNSVKEQRGFQPVIKTPILNFPFLYQNFFPLISNQILSNDEKEAQNSKANSEGETKMVSSPISSGMTNNLVQHPLVKKTLIELYGVNFELYNLNDEVEESLNNQNIKVNGINKNFYMCTACGYRGNTSRGVKQHGKLHLSQNENFAIINVTDSQPYLVYTSFGEDTNKKRSVCENDEGAHKKMKLDEKKGDDCNEANLNKSQTYCSKCNIQFQHINNFLVHKKSYCKD